MIVVKKTGENSKKSIRCRRNKYFFKNVFYKIFCNVSMFIYICFYYMC